MKRLSVIEQVTLSLLWFSLNFETAALLPIVIPAQLLLFVAPGAVGNAQQAVGLGWLSALAAAIALLAQPLTGAASDRTASRFGRRRPFVVLAMVIYVIGMLGLAWSPRFGIFIVGFILTQIAANIGTAAYQGLLPDRVPIEQRGAASGYLGMMTILGNVGSLVAAGVLLGMVTVGPGFSAGIRSGAAAFYLIGIGVLVIGTLMTVLGIREAPGSARGQQPNFIELWLSPLRHHNFRWVFLTRVSVMLGLTLFLTFIEYYFANVAHVSNFILSTIAVALLALGGAVIGALTLGMLSDRIGRVGIVAVATGLMTVAALAFVIAPQVPLWPLGLIFGAGYGGYTSVDWALAVDSLPHLSSAGKDMGVWSIASNLPRRRGAGAWQCRDRRCQRARDCHVDRLPFGVRAGRHFSVAGSRVDSESAAADHCRDQPVDELRRSAPVKWVTRANANVDRIACPWLIKRFIDPEAEFLFVHSAEVMPTATREPAIPYDVPDVELGHIDGRCSFESILLKYRLEDPALTALARIVHGADVASDIGSTPESAGLNAIARGFALLHGEADHEKIRLESPMYDALYAWCKSRTSAS